MDRSSKAKIYKNKGSESHPDILDKVREILNRKWLKIQKKSPIMAIKVNS